MFVTCILCAYALLMYGTFTPVLGCFQSAALISAHMFFFLFRPLIGLCLSLASWFISSAKTG